MEGNKLDHYLSENHCHKEIRDNQIPSIVDKVAVIK